MAKPKNIRTTGELLQEARKARNLTLANLAELTKIPERLLEAIELDQFEELSGPIYVRSFLQTYAKSVGVDARAVLDCYQQQLEAGGDAEEETLARGEVWEEEVEVRRVGFKFGMRSLRWVLATIGAILAIVVIVKVTGGRGQDGIQGQSAVVADMPAAAGVDLSGATGTDRNLATDSESSNPANSDPDSGEKTPATPQIPVQVLSPARDGAAAEEQGSPAGQRTDDKKAEPPSTAQPSGAVTTKASRNEPLTRPPTTTATRNNQTASQPETSAATPATTPPMTTPPAAPAGRGDLVFAGGVRHALVLRVLWTGDAPASIEVRQYQQASSPAIQLPGSGAPPLLEPAVVPGQPYRVRDGIVMYWGAGRLESFELRLSSRQDFQVQLNGKTLAIPAHVIGRWWLLDSTNIPE